MHEVGRPGGDDELRFDPEKAQLELKLAKRNGLPSRGSLQHRAWPKNWHASAGRRAFVIGGLAVSYHGYTRFTADVGVLVSRAKAVRLPRFKLEHGWKRHREGFKNTALDVGLDIRIEGECISPRSEEVFPDPASLRLLPVRPLPLPPLSELIVLRVMSARARDDADTVELLKRHRARIQSLQGAPPLPTDEVRAPRRAPTSGKRKADHGR